MTLSPPRLALPRGELDLDANDAKGISLTIPSRRIFNALQPRRSISKLAESVTLGFSWDLT